MQLDRVIIVSGSALLGAALSQSISQVCSAITVCYALDELDSEVSWEKTVVIVDVVHSEETTARLIKLDNKDERLRSVILLLRNGQDPTEFLSLAALVGAILPSSCDVSDILLTAKLLRRGLIVVPSGGGAYGGQHR